MCSISSETESCGRSDEFDDFNEELFADWSVVPLITKDPYPSYEYIDYQKSIIALLMEVPKGIFLFDDGSRATGLKFAANHIMNDSENRKTLYSTLLKAVEPSYISGVVLSEDILNYTKDRNFGMVLEEMTSKGMLFGVRVDKGVGPLSGNYRDECRTDGQDRLQDRIVLHKDIGCKFVKWRTLFHVSDDLPTTLCLAVNCGAIGRFAAIAQNHNLIPMIELELFGKSNSYHMEHSAKVLEKILSSVIATLSDFNVSLETTLILMAPPHCSPGCSSCNNTIKDTAQCFLRCLKRTLPVVFGGVAVLSGIMSEEMATMTFSAIVEEQKEDGNCPWPFTFAFGKALTHSAIKRFDVHRISKSVAEFQLRLKSNSIARLGQYDNDNALKLSSHEILPMHKFVH